MPAPSPLEKAERKSERGKINTKALVWVAEPEQQRTEEPETLKEREGEGQHWE